MSSSMEKIKDIERKKRFAFLGFETAGILSTLFVSGWLGLPLIGVGVYFGLDWFKFRAQNGMRF